MVERVKEVTIAVYVDTNENTYSEVFDDVEEGRDYLQGLCNDLFPDWSQKEIDKIKWISVKERLPEIPENDYSNRVLLLRADRFIVIARIEKCVRFVRPLQEALIVETDNGDPIEEFTHWMPLPEPPKEEK